MAHAKTGDGACSALYDLALSRPGMPTGWVLADDACPAGLPEMSHTFAAGAVLVKILRKFCETRETTSFQPYRAD